MKKALKYYISKKLENGKWLSFVLRKNSKEKIIHDEVVEVSDYAMHWITFFFCCFVEFFVGVCVCGSITQVKLCGKFLVFFKKNQNNERINIKYKSSLRLLYRNFNCSFCCFRIECENSKRKCIVVVENELENHK